LVSRKRGCNGFWRVDHGGLRAILRFRDLTWEQARVYLALGDLTYGFGNPNDVVSAGQIATIAGVARPHVYRALNALEQKGLAGSRPLSPRRVLRWIVWPAPDDTKPGITLEGAGDTKDSTKPGTKVIPNTVSMMIPAVVHTKNKKRLIRSSQNSQLPKSENSPPTSSPGDFPIDTGFLRQWMSANEDERKELQKLAPWKKVNEQGDNHGQ